MSPTPKTLTTEDLEKLLLCIRDSYTNDMQERKAVRNFTIALLMCEAGLRVGEVVKLKEPDLYYNSVPVTSIIISAEIAKNKRERQIPVSQRLSDALKNHYRNIQYYGNNIEPCFVFHHGRPYRPITTRQVERIIRAAAIRALGRPVHPHVLRHTFATRLMRVTSARTVQELLGHTSLSSTQIYTHPNSDDLKKAIDSIDQDQPGESPPHKPDTS